MDEERCCGTCMYNGYDFSDRMFICENEDSYSYGCATRVDDVCDDYEEC